jgi:hypothetical protein
VGDHVVGSDRRGDAVGSCPDRDCPAHVRSSAMTGSAVAEPNGVIVPRS